MNQSSNVTVTFNQDLSSCASFKHHWRIWLHHKSADETILYNFLNHYFPACHPIEKQCKGVSLNITSDHITTIPSSWPVFVTVSFTAVGQNTANIFPHRELLSDTTIPCRLYMLFSTDSTVCCLQSLKNVPLLSYYKAVCHHTFPNITKTFNPHRISHIPLQLSSPHPHSIFLQRIQASSLTSLPFLQNVKAPPSQKLSVSGFVVSV